ncbi:UDP-N-acetylmuramate--L-alanine ligase [Paenarthrobacter sp. DKR-5]|uniref:UDP-N-acetylmuramate--L-alanine ligase n=1 Tax=Paenarthrobacter sp. DKR-5 TaxID=2835535 RepID=UPI001BDC3B22|nr:UDP-N-acetylmuramate--L-alanine ligase [Paenarthrobacter sp. DKR-5]MBT1002149.1 UDP-N-acetylmuramate--L-alanine ligase [Paenarthrobacter sp. DKR-5]
MSPAVLADLGRVHFVGIGGAGMSAVARIMLAQGVPVSGSDANESAGLRALAALGARVVAGHSAEAVADVDTVVISSAIRESNPELAVARSRGLTVLHRSEALAAAMAADRVVAVAGTHGKTTTTSMITVLLRGAGLDPSFAIGATVPALGVNAAHGRSDIFVAEADESDGSFLNYRPGIAVVTNVEPDHLDHYGTAEAVYESFRRFAALLPAGGLLVACADDAGSRELGLGVRELGACRVVLYGQDENADVRLLNPAAPGAALSLQRDGLAETFPLRLQVPGVHNALNAAAAFAVAVELGVEPAQAAAALAAFAGAARRFEFKGAGRGVRVFDDYAHHPTEVHAALTAARTVAEGHRVHVIFQPHLFSRTREFAAEFAAALDLADTVAVLDIYPAREDPIPGVTSELITARMQHGSYQPDKAAAVAAAGADARPGDIILTVGAGDVTALGADVVAALGGGHAG